MLPHLTILPSHNIDKKNWDQCIAQHANGLLYSTTGYLDAMADNWHGMVVNDYEAVMPLPWKKKLGVRYAYIPPFIQQLGIIGDLAGIDVPQVMAHTHDFVPFADIHFNFSNTAIQNVVKVIPRTNLVIDLNTDHNTIRSNYKNGLKESIRKAAQQHLHYSENTIDNAVHAYRAYNADRIKHHTGRDYQNILQACTILRSRGQCIVRAVTDDTGTIVSIALLLKDGRRLYNLMNATTDTGRKQEANHFLFDSMLKEFCGQPMLFDFEGSELPGVQAFYKKFGAINQPYFHYRYNGLPWPLRLLKR